ncbi:MAG: sensor histidine kinase, partial [Pseudomonadota bacterium]|nr:sensor histidine kinase [Pseudomonadota bacterium]
MNPAADIAAPETPTAREPGGDGPALAAWHAGWAVAAALLALGARWLDGVEGPVFYGVLAMVVPGVTGLALLQRDGDRERMTLLGLWGVAAAVAASLSGGLTGPLAGFVFLPLTAGLALGGVRRVQVGAMAVAFAALAGS